MNIDPIEYRIIHKIAKKAIAAGYTISVGDGEEFVLTCSASPRYIMAEVGHTDETVFVVRQDGKKLGFIHFIHGNGEDVVTDCTDNAIINQLCE